MGEPGKNAGLGGDEVIYLIYISKISCTLITTESRCMDINFPKFLISSYLTHLKCLISSISRAGLGITGVILEGI